MMGWNLDDSHWFTRYGFGMLWTFHPSNSVQELVRRLPRRRNRDPGRIYLRNLRDSIIWSLTDLRWTQILFLVRHRRNRKAIDLARWTVNKIFWSELNVTEALNVWIHFLHGPCYFHFLGNGICEHSCMKLLLCCAPKLAQVVLLMWLARRGLLVERMVALRWHGWGLRWFPQPLGGDRLGVFSDDMIPEPWGLLRMVF